MEPTRGGERSVVGGRAIIYRAQPTIQIINALKLLQVLQHRRQLQLVSFSWRVLSGGNLIEIAFAKRLGVQLLLSINKINLKQLRFFQFLQRSLDSCCCGRNTTQLMVRLFACVCVGVCMCVRVFTDVCVCVNVHTSIVYAYKAQMQMQFP